MAFAKKQHTVDGLRLEQLTLKELAAERARLSEKFGRGAATHNDTKVWNQIASMIGEINHTVGEALKWQRDWGKQNP